MKRIVFVIGFFLSTIFCFSQDMENINLYKPDDNAKEKMSDAIKKEAEKNLVNMYSYKLAATGVCGVQGLIIL